VLVSDESKISGRDEGQGSDDPSIAHLLASSNWEERVAKAREQREKVLAQKREAEANAPEGEAVLALFPHPVATEPEAVAAPVAPVAALEEKRSLKSGVLLVAACATGLGIGLVLGAAFVMNTVQSAPPTLADAAEPSSDVIPTEATAQTGQTEIELATEIGKAEAATPEAILDTPAAEITQDEIAQNTGPRDRAPKLALNVPEALPNSGVWADTEPGTILASTQSGAQPTVPALPVFYSLKEVSQPAAPKASVEPDISVWDLGPGLMDGALQTAATGALQLPSLRNYQTLMAPLAIDASHATARLDNAPEISVARAGSEALVAFAGQQPAILAGPPSAGEAAWGITVDRFQTGIESGIETGIDASAALPRPSLVAPDPQQLASLPPEIDLSNGIPVRPAPRPTLASTLGLSGEELASINLVLHAPSSIEQDALETQIRRIEETGFTLQKTVRPSFKISKPHLRFYNESDRALTTLIAEEMGIDVRDFSSVNARAGLIEVWLAGQATAEVETPSAAARATQPRRQATPRRNSQSRPRAISPVERLRNNLANRLRNGDHL